MADEVGSVQCDRGLDRDRAGHRAARSIAAAGGSSPGCARRPTPSRCARPGSERLEPLMLDVTDDGADRGGGGGVARRKIGDAGLDGLVNNAGIAVPGPLETLPIDDFRRQLEVNLTAQVAVTQALLPAIRARARPDRLHHLDRRPASPSRCSAPTTPPSSGSRRSATSSARSCGPGGSRSRWSSRARSRRRSGSGARRKPTRSPLAPRDEHADLYGDVDRALTARSRRQTAPRAGIPPEKVAAADRARAQRLAAPAPATWSAPTRAARRSRSAALLPTRLVDWLVARATGM